MQKNQKNLTQDEIKRIKTREQMILSRIGSLMIISFFIGLYAGIILTLYV